MIRGAIAALVLVLGLAACADGSTTARPSVPPTPSATSPDGAASAATTVDPALLDVLPAVAAGIERAADQATAADVAATAGLADDIGAIAVALYAGPDDYAVATVARPHPGVVDEDWFREWRDSFDAAVCDQAGGVDTGHSTSEIDGRTVHRATCTGGVVIRHVLLGEPDRIVSIQGAGPSDLGGVIVADLTE